MLIYNDALEPSERIRIVSISTGLSQNEDAFHRLIHQAEEQGILVFTSTMPTVTNPPLPYERLATTTRRIWTTLITS